MSSKTPPDKVPTASELGSIVRSDVNEDVVSKKNKDDGAKEKKKTKKVSMMDMFRYADSTSVWMMVTGAIAGTANGAVMPLFSIILGGLFDAFNSTRPADEVAAEYALYFVYLSIASFIVGALQVGCFTYASERISLLMRERYLDAVLQQDVEWFDINNSGELTSKIAENTIVVREALGEKLGALFQFMSMFITGFIVGFYYNWELTLIICCCAPVLAIGGAFFMKLMADVTSEGLGVYAAAGAIVEESFSMIRTVASLGAEKKMIRKYETELQVAEADGIKKGLWTGLGLGFTMGVMFLSYGLAFWYGSVLIERSRIDAAEQFPPPQNLTCYAACMASDDFNPVFPPGGLNSSENIPADICTCPLCDCGCYKEEDYCVSGGDVTLVFFSVLMGAFAIGQASPSFTAFSNGQVAAKVIYEIIDAEPQIEKRGGGGKTLASGYDGTFYFQNVNFTYPSRPDVQILKDFTLNIESMKTCALVGGSGSGKSTIVALLERFYDPNSGQVLLDGTDLKELDVQWLRAQIGLVGQEPVLFATTIFKNIAYGVVDGNATMEDVIDAAKKSNAHDFIMSFPKGYDTMVGEKGSQLSGGQKQRIAIARSIIRDPSILLLDEATSALDNESERIVQEALDKLLEAKKRTTVVIAHRLTTIRHADKIVVMEQGEIVEQGNHDELMTMNGHYSMLVAASERIKKERGGDTEVDLSAVASVTEQLRKNSVSGGEIDLDRLVSDVEERMASSRGGDSNAELTKSGVSAAVLMDNPSATVQVKSDAAASKDDGAGAVAASVPKKKVGMSRLKQFIGSEKWLYIPGCICAALVGSQMPIFSVIFADLITAFYVPTLYELADKAFYYSMLFVALGVGLFISQIGQMYCFAYIGEKMTTRLRLALYHSLIHQDIGFFDLPENSTGALTTKVASDAALVKASLADRANMIVMNSVTVILGLTIGFVQGWELTLVLVALLPLMVISGILQMYSMAGFAKEDSKVMEEASQVLTESIMGIRTVAAFSLRGRLVDLYSSFLVGPSAIAKKKGYIGGLGFGFSQFVIFICYAVAFYVGGLFIVNENMDYDFNKVLAVFFAVVMTGMGLGQASSMAPDLSKASVATANVFAIIDTKSKVDASSPDGEKPDTITGKLDFTKIEFAYPTRPDAPVFKNLNLEVQAGTTVALVGASGSGKSTVVQLVERFYDPAAGSVALDGNEVKSLNVRWYRNNIGLVSQEPRLFRGTIKENIAYGLPDVDPTDEQIQDAAKSSNAHDFIVGFPDGYDTDVGAAGSQLSGGQKQRIAIARAIIRDPSILILDEATSALDNESERIVQEALDKLMEQKKRTTLIVAHRLSTIRNADKIVVVNEGSIVEQGTHDELLATGVYYPKLYQMQKDR